MIKIITSIIPIRSNPAEARVNPKANMRVAPARWRTRHKIEKVETADSKFIKTMKEKYGSNVKNWPSYPTAVDIEITNAQIINPPPKKFNLKVRSKSSD